MRGNSIGRFFHRVFHWAAASDPEILDRVPHGEREKQWGYGTLVVIPAVLGWIAMTYAISTLTSHAWIYLPAGVLWSLIVFAFDRFIVSTFRKSASVIDDIVTPVFASRLVFAIFVGVVVAHPLVLLIFSQSIEARIERDRGEQVLAMEETTDQRVALTEQKIRALEEAIGERESKRDLLQERLVLEIDGIVTGSTTGIPGRGESAKEKERQLAVATSELEEDRARSRTEIGTLRAEIDRLVNDGRTARDAYSPTDDYLARANALEKLSREEPHVRKVMIFLILFFVFIDTLPILFKALTAAGPYDAESRAGELQSYDAVEKRLGADGIPFSVVDLDRGSRRESPT